MNLFGYTTVQETEGFIYHSLFQQEIGWETGVPLPNHTQH